MALLPVATNRVSTALNTQRLLFQLNNDQLAIQRQYDQLSTGRRVLRISDDPTAASAALGLQRGISLGEQFVRNADVTTAFHQATDTALNRVDQALIQARGISVEAAQNVISDQEREALAISIRQTLDSVVGAGNSLFIDHQLLGGVLNPKESLSRTTEGIRYTGSDAVSQTKVGGAGGITVSTSGADALGVASTFHVGGSLNAALNADTRLVDLRRGLGVKPGVLNLSDGVNQVQVDLTRAATIGDVADSLRAVNLGGRSISVVLGTDSISLRYADGLTGTLAIADSPGDRLATDLSISNVGGFRPIPLVGDRLSPRVTQATPLSRLANGAGVNVSNGIVIDRGDQRFTVDLSGATTLGDVLIAINRSDAGVRAELDQANGQIHLRSLVSGVDYRVGENGGNAATALGIRTATSETLLSDLDRGRGLTLENSGPDLRITRPDGVVLDLELGGAGTIGDVINLIRNHPSNQDTRRVLVSLASVGNGIQLSAPPGTGQVAVDQLGTSEAGVQLGLVPVGSDRAVGAVSGNVSLLTGRDYLPKDAGGAIDTLLRLEKAVRDGDTSEIGRLQARLDVDLDNSSRTRGRVGVETQNVADLKSAAQDQTVSLQSQLSDAVDADFATVISELNAKQASLEASLRFIGQTAQLTVLNYL